MPRLNKISFDLYVCLIENNSQEWEVNSYCYDENYANRFVEMTQTDNILRKVEMLTCRWPQGINEVEDEFVELVQVPIE